MTITTLLRRPKITNISMDDIIPENKSQIHANILNIVYQLMSEHVKVYAMEESNLG